jgi:glutamate formiminotransferase
MRKIIDKLEEALAQVKRFEDFNEEATLSMGYVEPETLAEAITAANSVKKELEEWGVAAIQSELYGSIPGYQLIESEDVAILCSENGNH